MRDKSGKPGEWFDEVWYKVYSRRCYYTRFIALVGMVERQCADRGSQRFWTDKESINTKVWKSHTGKLLILVVPGESCLQLRLDWDGTLVEIPHETFSSFFFISNCRALMKYKRDHFQEFTEQIFFSLRRWWWSTAGIQRKEEKWRIISVCCCLKKWQS